MTVPEPSASSHARDAARTRAAILAAAQYLFSEKGYTTTGVREIASRAGVNSTLVRRYFGSKEGLLRASLEELMNVDLIVAGDRATVGQRAASMLLQSHGIANPVAMMMLAMADQKARALCSAMVHDNVILPLAAWLGGDDAIDRATQLNVLWTGYIAQRHLPLQHLVGERVRSTEAWVARVTQAIVDGG